jgi:hypothetical protein
MAFDLSLSIRLSSDRMNHPRNWPSSQGAPLMNEWLDEELKDLERAKQDKAAKDSRLKLRQQQTQVLWKDLIPVLKDAIEKINTRPEFRKLTGGLAFSGGSDREMEIRKVASPAIILTIKCEPTSLSLHYVLLKHFKAESGLPSFRSLHVELDDDGEPYLKDLKEDKPFDLEEAAHHILRPFLRPELLQ